MIRRFVVAAIAAVAALALSSCTVDCQVCGEYEGTKECSTASEVKSSECKDCTDDVIIKAAKDDGDEITSSDISMAKGMGVSFSCEKK